MWDYIKHFVGVVWSTNCTKVVTVVMVVMVVMKTQHFYVNPLLGKSSGSSRGLHCTLHTTHFTL